jgi:hypothetical protein
MMDNREAARIIPYLLDRCHSKAEETAIQTAVKALQEREERARGCEFCLNTPEDVAKILGRNYCSKCGRKLYALRRRGVLPWHCAGVSGNARG